MAVASSRVNVGTTATLIAADIDSGSVLVRNKGAAVVDLGSSSVASGAGFELGIGESAAIDLSQGDALYGITASGTVAVHVLRTGV